MEKQNVLKLVSPIYAEIMQMSSFSSHLSAPSKLLCLGKNNNHCDVVDNILIQNLKAKSFTVYNDFIC